MAKNINLQFTRARYYKGVKYNVGDVVKMSMDEAKPYIEYNSGKIVHLKKVKKYEDMDYKTLQALCKEKNINAAGKKEELVERLNQLKNEVL